VSRGDVEMREVEAMSESQIWFHKHLIHFMAAFIATGLPQIWPEQFGWIALILGYPLNVVVGGDPYSVGIAVARWIHRLAAVGLVATMIPFAVKQLADIGKWEIWPECWSPSCFARGVRNLVDYYVHKRHVEVGKYNLGQKLWTWIAAITLVAMGWSGMVLWFRDSFDPSLWALAHTVHDIGFFIFMIMLPVHIYLAAVIPEHRPMVEAMFRTGKLPLEYVKKHHPKWYRKIVGEKE